MAQNRTPMQEALAAELPKFDPGAATPKPATDPKTADMKTRATLIRLPANASERPTPNEGGKEIVVLPK